MADYPELVKAPEAAMEPVRGVVTEWEARAKAGEVAD
jgi:hypothetical protein